MRLRAPEERLKVARRFQRRGKREIVMRPGGTPERSYVNRKGVQTKTLRPDKPGPPGRVKDPSPHEQKQIPRFARNDNKT